MATLSKESYLTLLSKNIPFADYITATKKYIKDERQDLNALKDPKLINRIIDANSPFELMPGKSTQSKYPYGALLIHGLLDCPFSLRDIGCVLQQQGILSRAILLPGHGTTPEHLLDVSYQDWMTALRYGIEQMQTVAEKIFLMGYSTGAALSLYHVAQQQKKDHSIAGVIMLSPAIKIKAPIGIVVGWHKIMNWATRNHTSWFYREPETDYAKYRSVTFNAVKQVALLTNIVRNFTAQEKAQLTMPVLMILSQEDDTISSHAALEFFSKLNNRQSECLLYAKKNKRRMISDNRIVRRATHYPALNIKQFSHMAIPFAPTNAHYGQQGDFMYASHPNDNIYGAYNRIETHASDVLFELGVLQRKRHELTYNPDFDFMSERICEFVLKG